MYMTLARTYSVTGNAVDGFLLADGSSYINPALYNYVFVESDLASQNFWVQLKFDLTARRAISKSLVPYL